MTSLDIDTLSSELTTELAMSRPLSKALPPKLKYRFYRWLRTMASRSPDAQHQATIMDTVKAELEKILGMKTLKKNEAMASFYDSGMIKMDFGSAVSQKAKTAALEWAKKRGLKPVEVSLNKSVGSASSYVFAPKQANAGTFNICIQRVKFIA